MDRHRAMVAKMQTLQPSLSSMPSCLNVTSANQVTSSALGAKNEAKTELLKTDETPGSIRHDFWFDRLKARQQGIPATATARPIKSSGSSNSKPFKVCLLGNANSGKSSLFNNLMGKPYAAVSPKRNTTREVIEGHLRDDLPSGRHQIETDGTRPGRVVVIDCPGIVPYDSTKESRSLSEISWNSLRSADLGLLVIDASWTICDSVVDFVRQVAPRNISTGETEYSDGTDDLSDESQNLREAEPMSHASPFPPIVLVLSKVDQVEKHTLQKRRKLLRQNGTFLRTFAVSGRSKETIEKLKAWLTAYASKARTDSRESSLDKVHLTDLHDDPTDLHDDYDKCGVYTPSTETRAHDKLPAPSMSSVNLSAAELLEQTVRSYIFSWFNNDIPYGVEQKLVAWQQRGSESLFAELELHVKDSVVASIVCGRNGRLVQLLKAKTEARLTSVLGIKKVYVHFTVKALVQKPKKIRPKQAVNKASGSSALV